MTRERDLMAQVEVLKRERDAAREGIVSLDASKRHLVKEVERLTSALASERARVGELERGIREARAHIFAKLPEEQDPPRNRLQVVACMLNETLRMTAPSPGTDHEDRKP